MNYFIFIPIWVGIMAMLVGNNGSFFKKKNVLGTEINQISIPMAIIIFLPIILCAAYGDMIGDGPGYCIAYNAQKPDFSTIDWDKKDPGFTVVKIIIKKLFGEGDTPFRLSMAILHGLPVILVMRYYSSDYVTSIFLFVMTNFYTAWMLNGIRQFLAAVIIFAATPLLLKKNYILLIPIILAASTIHNTAILMVPVSIIVQGKAWNKRTVMFIIMALALMFISSNSLSFFDSALESAGIDYSMSAAKESGDDGTSFLRVLVNIVPTIICFVFRKQLDTENRVINICVNMSVITAGLYLISMVTSGILIGRLPGYTNMYNFILLPYLIKNVFTEQDSKTVNTIMIVMYIIYYYYQSHFVSGLF
ncbi:MAG: EpsG family protein [Clostridia bacterium]|nr:EpsG family protein [Clostridia bacterium]